MNLELIKAIVILPGTALVYIPGAMLWLVAESGAAISLAGLARPRFWFALVLGASGLALAVWTVRLFRTVGEGTPAPWAPPKRLVVRGPYRHVRNPMITSVLLMLGAESLFFGSWHLAGLPAPCRPTGTREASAAATGPTYAASGHEADVLSSNAPSTWLVQAGDAGEPTRAMSKVMNMP